MKRTIACLGLALTLAACSSGQTEPTVSLEKSLVPKIVMDVRKISLADRSGPIPLDSPYRNNTFSPTISDAVKDWASDHLEANGKDGQAIILIKKASLSTMPMPMKDGIDSWFTRQQAIKYVARVDVSIEANGPSGFAVADADASRSISLPEDPTEAERQDAYMTLLNGLMRDLEENLQSGIYVHMSKFLSKSDVIGSSAVPLTSDPAPAEAVPAAEAAPVQPAVLTPPPLPPAPPAPAKDAASDSKPVDPLTVSGAQDQK